MTPPSITIRLKPGREKPVLHGHPWVFSGAVAEIEGDRSTGPVAEVVSADGAWLARGLVQPASALVVRICTREANEAIDASFFAARIDRAIAFREQLFREVEDTDSYRLIYSEADGLSGLIVDRYADVLAVQVGTPALIPFLKDIQEQLVKRTGLKQIVVAAEEDAVKREGLNPAALTSSFPAGEGPVRIRESGFQFDVDLQSGQKTGFFLDQRINRRRVAAWAVGRRVLSAYCYTGAFEVHAAAAGATEIVGLDRSELAIKRAEEHHALNGTRVPVKYMKADVGDHLRRMRDANEHFDMIILDPPRFVSSRAQMEKGMRAYKDINLLAMKLLTPGGILATFSCSGQVQMADFRTMIGWASVDAGREVKILETLGQPPDHPVLAVFTESEYLKGLICKVE